MKLVILTVFVGISPWLWCYFWLLFDLLTKSEYEYRIYKTTDLLYHLGYLVFMILFGYYTFGVRLSRFGYQMNIYDIFELLYSQYEYYNALLEFSGTFFLLLLLGSFCVCWVMFFMTLFLYLRRTALSLYLYMFQYDKFQEFSTKYVRFQGDLYLYFCERVIKYTKNLIILDITFCLWPRIPWFLERNIFRFLLPSLFVYDWFYCDGNISKVFLVMPGYYIYSLIRKSSQLFLEFFTSENFETSKTWYPWQS